MNNPNIKRKDQTILFFEYLLSEFYDSHLNLDTNSDSSFRLYSPFYATVKNGKPIISNIWNTQIENLDQNLIGAEILKFNGIDFNKTIQQFPTPCNDKNSKKAREGIINRIVSGRRNEPRILTLKLTTNETIELDLDKLKIRRDPGLLTAGTENGIGIIRINNSIGDNDLIMEFDKSLDALMDNRALIVDIRNTVDVGNSYVARGISGIMGRFIDEKKPYQKHSMIEQYDGSSNVERSWSDYVTPRIGQYKKPVVILVGRWTGSMGEGLAIGFEGMGSAQIVGTEMERLADEMHGSPFKNQRFGYRLSVAKLLHVNGTPRENYVPQN